MKFMVLGSWSAADTQLHDLLGAEQARTRELTESGLVQQLLLRADGAGACMVVEGESADDVRAQLATLPLMQHDVMSIELVELRTSAG
jgi:muconolactone delta-isomerase